MTEKTIDGVKDLFFRVKQFYYGSAERTETSLAVSAGEVTEYVSALRQAAALCDAGAGAPCEKYEEDAPRMLARVCLLTVEALEDRNYRLAGDLAETGVRLTEVYRFPYLGRKRFVDKVLRPIREKHELALLEEEEEDFLSLPDASVLLRPSFRTCRVEGHYISEDTDDSLRMAHPLLYFSFVLLGALVFFGVMVGYVAFTALVLSLSGALVLLGLLGSALLGGGFFSLLMTFVRQYFGHKATLALLIGGTLLVALSWILL